MKFELYGMIHLPPLPGSPGYRGDTVESIIEYALGEAGKLHDAGFDGFIIENFMDYPFTVDHVSSKQFIILDEVSSILRREYRGLRIGINVLRNAGRDAVEIACRNKLDFIRVNAYLEPVWAPEGLLKPVANSIWDLRRRLNCDVEIYADVNVKHSKPILPYLTALRNIIGRGRVHGLIISGSETGGETPIAHVYLARKHCREGVRVLVGSGLTPWNIGLYIGVADGGIIGTYIKVDGYVENPIDPERAERIVEIRDILLRRLG